MPARATQVVGDLVRGDGKQVGLQLALLVEVRQTVEETDETFLHYVLTGRSVAQTPLHKRQKAALVARDQVLPGALVALTDLLNEQAIAFGCHGQCRSRLPTLRYSSDKE